MRHVTGFLLALLFFGSAFGNGGFIRIYDGQGNQVAQYTYTQLDLALAAMQNDYRMELDPGTQFPSAGGSTYTITGKSNITINGGYGAEVDA